MLDDKHKETLILVNNILESFRDNVNLDRIVVTGVDQYQLDNSLSVMIVRLRNIINVHITLQDQLDISNKLKDQIIFD